jgi:hypothetical protein
MGEQADNQGQGGSPALVLLAAAPLLLALLLLQLVGSPVIPLTRDELVFLGQSLDGAAFIPGQITFLAVVAVHICACVVALLAARDVLRRTPEGTRYGWVAAGLTAAVVVAFPIGSWLNGFTAYELSYHAFVEAFRTMGAGASFVGKEGTITPLVLAMLLPSWAGVASVAFMAAAAYAQLRRFPPAIGATGEARAAYVARIYERLRRCLYLLAIVLVTSTVSASLFFHLAAGFPVEPKTPEAGLIARLADFASELSIFWGCIYTLTLGAAVGLPLLLFQQRVGTRLETLSADESAAEECKRLTEAGILSTGGDQLKFLATFLAPLAAGPIANFAQATTLFTG